MTSKRMEKSEVVVSDGESLIARLYTTPHGILGIQPDRDGQRLIRLWRPDARQLYFELEGKVVEASQRNPSGLFEYPVEERITPLHYRVYHMSGLLAHDPYAFLPAFGSLDEHLFGHGVHYEIYNVLGAHCCEHHGTKGTTFAVWAPAAKSVSLIADFNHWDGRTNPMRPMGSSGVWELFIPGVEEGQKYKFEIRTASGELLLKSDPYGYCSELRPKTASVVFDLNRYQWTDGAWIEKRAREWDHAKPICIYEVHLGSWRQQDGAFLGYRQLAEELASYCLDMGFTHVELMPVAEHPLDESWGYQVSGYYAVTSRYGTPTDFQYFVDRLHQDGIGVIVDWVPAHFPTDEFSLARFDGTSLYEHADQRQGFHPHWGTHIFNYGRHEVSNFLIANALFWMDKMHVDGLRVDAVASMLYLDYGRVEGEWIPNRYGGRENLEAIEFLKHFNSVVHQRHPGVLTIAEESTAFSGVSHGLDYDGLGFDLKWNMGWMNDTLRYFSVDPFFRYYHQNELTFGLLYAFSERFALVLSHDEVVHGKRSLLSKMPGDVWQKFANLRLLYSYMICQPGKKLLFMGGEFGQWDEWYCKQSVHWQLLDFPLHRGIQNMVRDVNHLYQNRPALWERDFDFTGFEWVDFNDRSNCVISYRRKSSRGTVLCVHNFTPTYHDAYVVRMGYSDEVTEVFNSDAEQYGGSGKLNPCVQKVLDERSEMVGIAIHLAPLATMIFDVR